MHRRGILRSAFVAAAAALGLGRFATPARAQTKHIRLYVEMDVAPAHERKRGHTFQKLATRDFHAILMVRRQSSEVSSQKKETGRPGDAGRRPGPWPARGGR